MASNRRRSGWKAAEGLRGRPDYGELPSTVEQTGWDGHRDSHISSQVLDTRVDRN